MDDVTKIKMMGAANDIFEAFVDPARIGKLRFASSSKRWVQSRTITTRCDECSVDIGSDRSPAPGARYRE